MNFCCHPQTKVFVWIETFDHLQHTTVHKVSSHIQPGPALGMFDVFSRTGLPILGGPPFWTLKNFRINYVGNLNNTVDSSALVSTRRHLRP